MLLLYKSSISYLTDLQQATRAIATRPISHEAGSITSTFLSEHLLAESQQRPVVT